MSLPNVKIEIKCLNERLMVKHLKNMQYKYPCIIQIVILIIYLFYPMYIQKAV